MPALIATLWADDQGAVISAELILVVVLLIIGLIPGLVALRNTENASLATVGNSLLAIQTGFSFAPFAIGTMRLSPTLSIQHVNIAQVGGVSFSVTSNTLLASSAAGTTNVGAATTPVNPAP